MVDNYDYHAIVSLDVCNESTVQNVPDQKKDLCYDYKDYMFKDILNVTV